MRGNAPIPDFGEITAPERWFMYSENFLMQQCPVTQASFGPHSLIGRRDVGIVIYVCGQPELMEEGP